MANGQTGAVVVPPVKYQSFHCPLASGMHARPASQLATVASRFLSEIRLTNERTGTNANAKSVLSIVAADVRSGDSCRVRIEGDDAEAAHAAIGGFIRNVLPVCDEPLPTVSGERDVALPRSLRTAVTRWVSGRAVSSGIGHGIVVVIGGLALPAELANEPRGSKEQERAKLDRAMNAVRADLEKRLSTRLSEVEAGILRAHLSIANDVALAEKFGELIGAGRPVGQSVLEAGRFFTARLKATDSVYVRERAVDVEDICLQILENIYGDRFKAVGVELSQPSVVVADTLTPRQFLSLDKRHLKALVLAHGGVTSHVVILARSFKIPTLTGVDDVRAKLPAGRDVIVDANVGIAIPDVTPKVRRYYDREIDKLRRRREHIAQFVHAPAVTRDGRQLAMAANVASAQELGAAFEMGADGIGLFRTEMLYMDRQSPPSEEEQFAVYVQAARAAGSRPVIIRTFDVGGDKPISYLRLPAENNPFLGFRGVRIYAEHRDLFSAQLRAIVRASAFGKIWVMLPMVSMADELVWVKARIAEIQADLRAAGVSFDASMPLGIMVEVPSVAFQIEQLAADADFFSIGTNDLAQFFFAVDRDGDKVAGLCSTRHPAFLRLLSKIVDDVHLCGRWVGMCGEMAHDAATLPLLVGLGLDEISTSAADIPALKAAIAMLSADECRSALNAAMKCRNANEVQSILDGFHAHSPASSLLDHKMIVVDSDSATKEEAVKELMDALYATGRSDRPEAIEDAVWAREAVYSTGLGHGFAIPHCKSDAVAVNSMAVLRLRQPIDWGSLDGQPVQCVILLAMRQSDADNTHMKVFSTLARKLMHDEFREGICRAANEQMILQFLTGELGL